ncbi:hypothetical protein CHUAL_010979 [Chamberlinius hualienensis]
MHQISIKIGSHGRPSFNQNVYSYDPSPSLLGYSSAAVGMAPMQPNSGAYQGGEGPVQEGATVAPGNAHQPEQSGAATGQQQELSDVL